ncbi:MAG: sensor histidine kinase [Vicingaceae bacterium]
MPNIYKTTFLFCFFIAGIQLISAQSEETIKELQAQTKQGSAFEQQQAFLSLARIRKNDTAKFADYLSQVLQDSRGLSDSSYLELMNQKIGLLSEKFQHEKSKNVAHRARKVAYERQDSVLIANCYKQLSASCYKLGDFDSTNFYLKKAANYYQALGDSENFGLTTLRLGGVAYAKGDYSIALQKAFEASEIFKKTNENKQLATSYLQMGNIYYFLRIYDKASDYYRLSTNYFELCDDKLGAAFAKSNIALTKIKQDSFQVSLDMQREVMPLILKSGRTVAIGNIYYYLADAHLGLNNLDSAYYYTLKSDSINNITGFVEGSAYSLMMIAQIAKNKNQLDSAIILGKKALQLVEDKTAFEVKKEISYLLGKWYAESGNYESAYKMAHLNQTIRDSLDFDINSIERIAYDQHTKLEKRDYELKLARQEQLLSAEEKHNQQLLIIVLSIVAIISIFFAGVLSSTNKRNKVLNRELQFKQELIESELENKRALLKEIHHRVKNNLQIISSMLSIQSQYLQNEHLENIIRECRSRILSMSLIHESLYKREDNDSSLFSAYIKDLIPQLLETYHIDENKIRLEMDIDDIELSLDDSVPCGLIINEVVSNALKHAFPSGKEGLITIEMFQENEKLNLRLSDNGVGLPEGKKPEDQDTFGFLLIYTLVSQLDAELELDTENGLSYLIRWRSGEDKLLS